MIVVRPAASDDVDQLLTLAEEMDRFYGTSQVGSLEFRRQQIHDALFSDFPAANTTLAFDGDTAIGFAAYSFLWPAVGLTCSLYLKELFVSQAHRRRGLGRVLMESLFEVGRRHNCSRVEWTADRDNEDPRRTTGRRHPTAAIEHRVGGTRQCADRAARPTDAQSRMTSSPG
ncbi:GNAT family N-acetyltransferase [Kribbella sp. NBC_01484]|uniref:GNAT family N-acetyltransferase n=1 Tax=Kribbella sp. NBC_01484 TaxID=2903579 RepID=UPI002E35E990|nr:GNAT family N-acetyltransferase [Kribbella sp. NBC_01484]